MHGEMMGGHKMGGTGWCREMIKKRAWEYLDEDQTRQMILRMIDKKILYIETRIQLGQQKLETLKMMRKMVAQGGTGGK